MSSKLIGDYQLSKSNLIGNNQIFVFCTRKHPTPTKPKYYLLHKIGNKFTYISSLYQTDSKSECVSSYTFDFKENNYMLDINNCSSTAFINSINAINNMELG
jgi:hypothetical protein